MAETQLTVLHCRCRGVVRSVAGFHSASVCLAPNENIWVELREFPSHCTQSPGSVLWVEDGWKIIWVLMVIYKRDSFRKYTVHVCLYRTVIIWVNNISCFHNYIIYYLRIIQTEKRDHQQSLKEIHKTAEVTPSNLKSSTVNCKRGVGRGLYVSATLCTMWTGRVTLQTQVLVSRFSSRTALRFTSDRRAISLLSPMFSFKKRERNFFFHAPVVLLKKRVSFKQGPVKENDSISIRVN
jgi:hypothetical protein